MDEVPDFYSDPEKEANEEIGNRFDKLMKIHFETDYKDALAWDAGWDSYLESVHQSPENPDLRSIDTLVRTGRHIEYLLLAILKEIKK